MKIASFLLSAVLAAALGCTCTIAQADQLLVNPGFELGNFTPASGSPTYDVITHNGPQDLTGWTVGNSLAWGNNTTDINTHSGIGFVDLTGIGDTIPHGILNQTISTIIGQQYTFSIFETQDFSTSIVGFTVSANNVPLTLSGTPGFWADNSGLNATYGQMTGTFTAIDTSTTISIGSIVFGSTVFMIGLDDASVTGPAVSVPGPIVGAGLPGLLAGFGAMLAWYRKRRAAAWVTHTM
jgi:opacity protein-like surface antigen